MKNALKRTLSVALVLMMVMSCFTGMGVFAANDLSASTEITVTDGDASGSDVTNSDVSGSDVSDADVSDSDASDSDVSDSDVSGSDVSGSDVSGSDAARKIVSVDIDSGDDDKKVVSCLGGTFKAVINGENLYFDIALFQNTTRVGGVYRIGSKDGKEASASIPAGTYALPANETDKPVEYTLYAFAADTAAVDMVPEKGTKIAVVSVAAKTDDIVVSPVEYTFDEKGGSFEIIVRTNCTPSVSLKYGSWLKVEQMLNPDNSAVIKDGGVVLKVTAQANTGLAREDVVIFTKYGDTKVLAEVKITQDGISGAERLFGNERIATSVAISTEGWDKAETIILASGNNFADALAGAPLSAAADAPILLTMNKTTGVEKIVLDEIARLGAKKVYILGGTAAISSEIESAVATAGCAVTRLAGDTRYGTAVKIAEELNKLTGKAFTSLYFANAWNFPDALSVSSVAAIEGNPILYMPTTGEIETVTSKFVTDCKCKNGVILGGTAAVSAEGQTSLTKLGLSVSRVSGEDRYETSNAINKKFGALFTGNQIAVATGSNFPDALAGGALCAKLRIPVVLVSEKSADAALEYIKGEAPESLIVFGGPNAVSETIAVKLAGGIKQDPAK